MPGHIAFSSLAAFSLIFSALIPGVGRSQTAGLEELVVTASRNDVRAPRVGSSMSVITRDELETGRYRLVADALREVPGVAISRGGGLGAVTQARIRGAEGNHTLVLIDGIEANNPVSNSEFDFANLLVADIDRIEVLRGPQSALYGSDAIGGVINVITRTSANGARSSVRLESGTRAAREASLSLAGGGAQGSAGLSLTHLATDGFNIARFGNETDGYRNDTLSLHANNALGERATLTTKLRYIDSLQQFDNQDFSFPPSPTQGLIVDDDVEGALEQWFLRLQADLGEPGAAWQHRLAVDHTDTANEFFDGGVTTSANAGVKTKLALQSTRSFARNASLALAFEHEAVHYENRGATALAAENQSQHDRQTSAVAEYRARWRALDVSLSARYDANHLFKDAATYRITLARPLGAERRLHSSLGTGIANPGFFELFGYFPESFTGNPDLVPEKSLSFDVGLEQRFAAGRVRLDATYFHSDLEHELETVFDPVDFLATVVNLPATSERRGLELALNATLGARWVLAATWTYTDADQADGARELRRPRQMGSIAGTFAFAQTRGRLHMGLDYNGRQDDSEFIFATPEDRVTLDAFTLLRVAADYEIAPQWRLYGRIENLLDERYEEWFSYRSPGRTMALGFEHTLAR